MQKSCVNEHKAVRGPKVFKDYVDTCARAKPRNKPAHSRRLRAKMKMRDQCLIDEIVPFAAHDVTEEPAPVYKRYASSYDFDH